MIVDTSALVALVRDEPGRHDLSEAMLAGPCVIPAPVMVEYERVTALPDNSPDPFADQILDQILVGLSRIEDFTASDAEQAARANPLFGSGNGKGGTLNLLDLMVYAVAKRMDLPILCTGRDFSSTDAKIHPASRTS
jgi:ribonuclease VapC